MYKSILFGAAAAALFAGPAAAQPRAERGEGFTRAQVQSRVGAMFARVDADRDGFVTQAEADAARTAVRGHRRDQRALPPEQRGERRAALFARLDRDGNGVISRAEFEAPRGLAGGRHGRAERFERRGPRGAMGARFGAQAFARMDSDRDGRVSLGEATRFRLERFDRVDSNDDGRISSEERDAVRARRLAR
jgi:Ca2+-binding EF-hand superfamily protein